MTYDSQLIPGASVWASVKFAFVGEAGHNSF